MKTLSTFVGSCVVAGCLVVAVYGAPQADEPSSVRVLLDEIERQNREIESLRADLAAAGGVAGDTGSTGEQLQSIRTLLAEVERLGAEVVELRRDRADRIRDLEDARRRLAALEQFVTDHEQFGDDFDRYEAVLEAARETARLEQAEIRRRQREADQAERRARQAERRAERDAQRAEVRRLSEYRQRGFSPIGLDVFLSNVGFSYGSAETTRDRVDYIPGFGRYVRSWPEVDTDFSTMAISGSVLNGAEVPRNIGVAIVFFDDSGTQIGHETILVNNARPNVPYPFSTTIEMASNGPFATSSQYVLYADPSVAE